MSRAWRYLLILLIPALLTTGCVIETPGGEGGSSLPNCDINLAGSAADLTEEQNANAKAIIEVAMAVGAGREGAVVAIVTALQESTLRSVNYGDIMVNGQMSSSRGLFQQLNAWGPLADRLDPTKSAMMFFKGGAAGQAGLLDIPGWKTMSPEVAAQAVQRSENGSYYTKHIPLAGKIVDEFLGQAQPAPTCGEGSVLANGVSVTIPDSQFVAEAMRGQTIQAPNAGVAKGIAAGLSHLGIEYVWGGGGDGEGPNNGCVRGGGQLNSCGNEIGFDCSGLTAFILVQGGFASPGGNSGAQRSGGTDVPPAQGLPGDIVGFPGHVAMYLGNGYILEASTVGVPVHVVKLTRSDQDPVFHRYWNGTNS